VSRACSTYRGEKNCIESFGVATLVYKTITLGWDDDNHYDDDDDTTTTTTTNNNKVNFHTIVWDTWTGSICLRTDTNGGLL
jgi:hypothetical protein